MGLSFVHAWPQQRVAMGAGRAAELVGAEVARLGGASAMLICSEREGPRAETVVAGLPISLHWREVRRHVPVELAERATTSAREHGVDVIVSVGGGSTTGLAKAVALRTGIPIVAVPTTYAGSEATDVWGLTAAGVKQTGVDARVLPRSVVYDATLTLDLPAELTVASGLNALAHCVDSLWAPRAEPINLALALEGARALAVGLPRVIDRPDDAGGRDTCLYGAYLAAVAFSSAGSGMHHKICHVLGGRFDLPHAETHASVLPYVLAFNAPAVPELAARLAEALAGPGRACDGPAAALTALTGLTNRLKAPRALKDLGLREADLEVAVPPILAAVPASNPVPLDAENLRALLHNAWAGATPAL